MSPCHLSTTSLELVSWCLIVDCCPELTMFIKIIRILTLYLGVWWHQSRVYNSAGVFGVLEWYCLEAHHLLEWVVWECWWWWWGDDWGERCVGVVARVGVILTWVGPGVVTTAGVVSNISGVTGQRGERSQRWEDGATLIHWTSEIRDMILLRHRLFTTNWGTTTSVWTKLFIIRN